MGSCCIIIHRMDVLSYSRSSGSYLSEYLSEKEGYTDESQGIKIRKIFSTGENLAVAFFVAKNLFVFFVPLSPSLSLSLAISPPSCRCLSPSPSSPFAAISPFPSCSHNSVPLSVACPSPPPRSLISSVCVRVCWWVSPGVSISPPRLRRECGDLARLAGWQHSSHVAVPPPSLPSIPSSHSHISYSPSSIPSSPFLVSLPRRVSLHLFF